MMKSSHGMGRRQLDCDSSGEAYMITTMKCATGGVWGNCLSVCCVCRLYDMNGCISRMAHRMTDGRDDVIVVHVERRGMLPDQRYARTLRGHDVCCSVLCVKFRCVSRS